MLFSETGIHAALIDGVFVYNKSTILHNATRVFYTLDNLVHRNFTVMPNSLASYGSVGIYNRIFIFDWFSKCLEDFQKTFKRKKWFDKVNDELVTLHQSLRHRVIHSRVSETVISNWGTVFQLIVKVNDDGKGGVQYEQNYEYIGDAADLRILTTSGGLNEDASVLSMEVNLAKTHDEFIKVAQRHGAFKNPGVVTVNALLKTMEECGRDMELQAKDYGRFLHRFVNQIIHRHENQIARDKEAIKEIFYSSKHIDQKGPF